MTASERAAQIWPVLALAARNRQILTYEILGQLVGMARQGLGQVLEPIQSYCLAERLPALTAIVVRKDSGLPGLGFIASTEIPREQLRVFEQDWMAHGCPSPEAFERAAESGPQ